MKLKKCPVCRKYTLQDFCENCKEKTINAGYKYIKVKQSSKHNN